jgi:hypothetical protein
MHPSKPNVFSKASMGTGKVLQLMIGDIVQCPADVIVNAANADLVHGSGVAGAISKAGKVHSFFCAVLFYSPSRASTCHFSYYVLPHFTVLWFFPSHRPQIRRLNRSSRTVAQTCGLIQNSVF